jgi:hypothetical protein
VKIIGYTDNHAGHVKIQFGGWGGQRYFEFDGETPPKSTLIVLECAGLDYKANETWWDDRLGRAIKAWLDQNSYLRIPRAIWREATLEDWLESENAEVWQNSLGQLFPLEEGAAFWKRHETPLANLLSTAIRGRNDAEREAIFERVGQKLRRLSIAGAATGMMFQMAQLKLQARLDRARVKATREQAQERRGDSRLTPKEWTGLFAQLSNRDVLNQAILWVADDLIALCPELDDLRAGLATLSHSKKLREAVGYDTRFWQKFNGKLTLEPTESETTIDITEAKEQSVGMSFELLKAKRVGPIVPGRTALVITDARGIPAIYIRGERKLKFAAQRAPGGQIRKFGCTLTVQRDRKLENFLLDIERIDTLAQLDPLSAIPSDADEALRTLAEAARTDWKQARVLADMLIERQTGVDAEILRRHARNRGRANRR